MQCRDSLVSFILSSHGELAVFSFSHSLACIWPGMTPPNRRIGNVLHVMLTFELLKERGALLPCDTGGCW